MSDLPLGAILGAILGGVTILVLAAIFIHFIRRRICRLQPGGQMIEPSSHEVDTVDLAKFELPPNGFDQELDAKQTTLPGHEIDPRMYPGAELGGQDRGPVYGMPALEEPASELPCRNSPKNALLVKIRPD